MLRTYHRIYIKAVVRLPQLPLASCLSAADIAWLAVKERQHRETTFYCASGNIRSFYFKLKCADVAAHTLKNVVLKCCLP